MPPLPPSIACKECGHINESERVYCHNCGVKLDRSALVTPAQQQKQPSAEEVREKKVREIRKLMAPGGGFLKKQGVMLGKMLACALGFAVLIDGALPPQNLPQVPKGVIVDLPQIDKQLETLVAAPAGQQLELSQKEINAYLKVRFRKRAYALSSVAPITRSCVALEDGVAHLILRAEILGFPLYVSFSEQLHIDKKNGLKATCVGMRLGRLPLPGWVQQSAATGLPGIMASLKREGQLLQQAASAEIEPGKIVLRSSGPSAKPPSAPPAKP